MRQISRIVIHCTDSDDSLDIGFKEINDWHKQRGWLSPSGISCGYHYIVRRDGRIENGRPDDEIGAHVKGHNSDTLGIVWVGRNELGHNQNIALKDLIVRLCKKYGLDVVDSVFGHYELDKHKTCPNINMILFRAQLIFHF